MSGLTQTFVANLLKIDLTVYRSALQDFALMHSPARRKATKCIRSRYGISSVRFILGLENAIGRQDEVSEWLRRWTANPIVTVGVGSNPFH